MELEYAAVIIGFFTVGVLDDIFQIKPARKGLMLVVPCAMAGVVTGEIWLAALCWIAANAYNLLDHADGVAGASAFGSLLFVLTPLGIAAAGASAGFLVHNFPRARLFMGDGGSYALGAILVLAWYQTGPVGVLLGIAVPCADTAFVVVRRCLAGRAPWIGGVDHTGHVMLRAGVPPRLMPFIYGGAAAGFAGLGSWIY
jgi:UDP-GlcNAc:undecaprenyl-phosphate GlcNAc-1-phosphate transferase